MKKLFLALLLVSTVCLSVFAQNSTEQKEGWSAMSYENIPILKVLEAREGYVVIYQKNQVGTGSTVIPKTWGKGTPENPKKFIFRKLEPGLTKPFMTIVKKNGEFHRVILTLPPNKSNSVWGSVRKIEEGLDKTNLNDVVL